MLVLDIPRPIPRDYRYISLPLYHRPHLGVADKQTVFVCFIPNSNLETTEPRLPQLIISSSNLQLWGRMWRLSVFLRDRSGLVHEVTDTLRRHQVNIIAAESGPVPDQGLHQVELVFCCNESQLPLLKWTLLAYLVRDIEFDIEGQPRLSITPMNDLWEAKRVCDAALDATKGTGASPIIDTALVEVSKSKHGKDLRIRLPRGIRDALKRHLQEVVGGEVRRGYFMRVSDTTERVMRVCFFRSSDPVLYAAVEHKDEVGALASITKALQEQGFTILTLLHTPGTSRNKSIAEIVVFSDRMRGKTSEQKKEELESILMDSMECVDLKLRVSYPRTYTSRRSWKRIGVRKRGRELPEEAELSHWHRQLRSNLEMLHEEVVTEIQLGQGGSVQRARMWRFIKALLTQYAQLTLLPAPKTLFISCHYAGGQLNIVRRIAESEFGFSVLTGERLEAYPDQVSGLRDRLSACTHFLGVWTRDGALKAGDDLWPSPWLLWELGVAEALGRTWRLLVDESLREESWKRIHPSQQHTTFAITDFETRLRYVLAILSET